MAGKGESQHPPYDRAEVADLLRRTCRTAESDVVGARADLLALAGTVAARGLAADDRTLSIPARTAVRLLEQGRPEVAGDVMRHHMDRLPVFTSIERGRVFAWLPGFHDPRAATSEDVYDISDRIVLRAAVDEIRWADGKCVLGGVAHLSHLVAERDDEVVVLLRRPDGRTERFPAVRTRRPDRVADTGANLVRLAWSGFSAEVDPDVILDGPARWAVDSEVSREGVVRTAPLAVSEAAGLRDAVPFDLPTGFGPHIRVAGTRNLTVGPPAPSVGARRFVPRPARRVLRSLRDRAESVRRP